MHILEAKKHNKKKSKELLIKTHNKRELKKVEETRDSPCTLSVALRSVRQSEGFTRVEFAKRLGISTQELNDLEHDRKNVSPEEAAGFAKALGLSVGFFVKLAAKAF
jgi:DNA-binding transcriptional regulator YiaG